MIFAVCAAIWGLTTLGQELKELLDGRLHYSTDPPDTEENCLPMFISGEKLEALSPLETQVLYDYRSGQQDIAVCTDDSLESVKSHIGRGRAVDSIQMNSLGGCSSSDPAQRALIIQQSFVTGINMTVEEALDYPPAPGGYMWVFGVSRAEDETANCRVEFRWMKTEEECSHSAVYRFQLENEWLTRLIITIVVIDAGFELYCWGKWRQRELFKLNDQLLALIYESSVSMVPLFQSLNSDTEINVPDLTYLPYVLLTVVIDTLGGIVAPLLFIKGCRTAGYPKVVGLVFFKACSVASTLLILARDHLLGAGKPGKDSNAPNPTISIELGPVTAAPAASFVLPSSATSVGVPAGATTGSESAIVATIKPPPQP